MPHNSWQEDNSNNELDPISSFFSEWSDPEDEEEEFRSDFFQGLAGRRQKAALVLMTIWGGIIALHYVWWGYYVILSLTGFVVIQSSRLVFGKPKPDPEPLTDAQLANAPTVSILVSAKNEEAVVGKLVKMLCNLDYPADKYELWVIDDHSTDKTPELLDKLAEEYKQLKVLHRSANATGGKCGALNQALALSKGEIIAVFDADAKVSADLLRRVVPLFATKQMGAVQVRKAIANSSVNFWTRGQDAEMALDSYFQQQRIAVSGIGELRGNGQFVRRTALARCGGWNEQTITDDLDLTIRLHLDGWEIGFLQFPAVEEEGVETAIALWHQRNRWAEGGYQRYLDYWRWLGSKRLSLKKKMDMFTFLLLQYLVPTAIVPDTLIWVARDRLPIVSPLTGVLFSMSLWGMFAGLRRIRKNEQLSFAQLLVLFAQAVRGMIYMLHWTLVMSSTTARMSVRPKRLKWVKTVHQGSGEESFEF
ncbi:MAG: glycosyltransferase family 2 protein [Oscillatoria sp. PMC 1051.18]|nr:glycosyltransferase family 2 protein [Oscillatoria sp. PMC 1050.18]MEC5029140.1 glycosyltransferase family 2 protein [Oscillatoria sp. PMC 1051.18]